MLPKYEMKKFCFVVLFFNLVTLVSANSPESSPQPSGFSYFPQIIGIPDRPVIKRILPGYYERAFAIQTLIKELYNSKERESLFREFPHWIPILENHPGYFSELVDRIPDTTYARLYGPDIWTLKNGKSFIGEENANPGGADFHQIIQHRFLSTPEFGTVPYNPNDQRRWIIEIIALAHNKLQRKPDLVVWADEASISNKPIAIEDGRTITPPFAVGREFIQRMYESVEPHAKYMSLVDQRRHLFVHENQLFFKHADGHVQKVDVLVWVADIESCDPTYAPQNLRNSKAGKSQYNETAALVGIPGLIEAWLSGSFIMINNPTSILPRSKLFPPLIDEFIKKRFARDPHLPTVPTMYFADQNGSFSESSFATLKANPKNFVVKGMTGGGGRDVYVMQQYDNQTIQSLLHDFEEQLRKNPYAFIAQPFLELDQITNGKTKLTRDLRILSLVSGTLPTDFSVIPSLHLLTRVSPQLKLNASSGGKIALSIVKRVRQPVTLDPIPFNGNRESAVGHYIRPEHLQLLLQDGAQTSLMTAHLARDVYLNPDHVFNKFPALKPIIEKSFFYRPQNFQSMVRSGFPIVYFLGPDLYDLGPTADSSKRYQKLEINPTNIGGLIRLVQSRAPGMTKSLKKLFRDIATIYSQRKPGETKPFTVYLVEDSQIGRPGGQKYEPAFASELSDLRNWFRETFNIELVSRNEMKYFKIENNQLSYSESGSPKKVDIFYSNFEPDFLDSTRVPDSDLRAIMPEGELKERRLYGLPGLFDVIENGNLFLINAGGVDIVGLKSLLPYYPSLTEFYLGQKEIIKTAASNSFMKEDGSINEDLINHIRSQPEGFVIKNGEITGGGGGVYVLKTLKRSEIDKLLEQVRFKPHEFVAQNILKPWVNPFGFRTELRTLNVVSFDPLKPGSRPEMIIQFPTIYGRGAMLDQPHANLIPSGEDQLPGFVVPLHVDRSCARAIEVLGRRWN